MEITRRSFVMGCLVLGVGLAAGQVPARAGAAAQSPSATPAEDPPAVLYDLTRCAGCHLCEIGCQLNKGLPPDISLISFRTADPGSAPGGPWAVRRHQCMHCLDPACVSACPVAAMQKTPAGPVIYADERCLGCRYCMNACPFGVPTFDWDSGLLDQALIRKCDFCAERQAQGKRPACVEACPTGAVSFGRRSELLERAHALISAHPDRYVDHVYGETEAGGTSFLIISGTEFAKLGLPQPGAKALPPLPEKVMGAVLPFALAWAGVLGGVTAATHLGDRAKPTQKEGGR